MSDAIRKVVVDLGERRYDILVGAGLIADAGTHLKPLLRRARIAVVTDETVARLHLPALQESLDVAGIHHDTISAAAGRKHQVVRATRKADRMAPRNRYRTR